ncbi:MAG TPA: hypothetical protein VL021_09950 [Brumimicrobium sp.]|nr:hypothetical protein [Brumimicrobium sp.]
MKKLVLGWIVLSMLILISCSGNEHYVPKPSTYLSLYLPERNYEVYKDACGYTYNKPEYFNVKTAGNSICNRDIELTDLNGTIHLSRIDMDTTLAAYVNYTIDKIGEHKVMATAIYDSVIIRPDAKVYGTFFELQGNVASPLQFYLTDSTDRFISGMVFFNSRPNYDSLKPVLNFVKKDILELMNTLEWD